MKVAIVYDEVASSARPDEIDAIVQAKAVADALRTLGHESVIISASLNLKSLCEQLECAAPDLVFNLTESLGGHSRLIHVAPALLEGLQIPYTGASAQAQFVTSNKLLAKQIMHAAGLPTPAWLTRVALDNEKDVVGGRFIIKSVWEHASIGIDESSIVDIQSGEELGAAIDARLSGLGGEAFAEQFIDGREFNLALLGPEPAQVLPPAEILFDGFGADQPRIVGYSAKWDERSFEYNNTQRRYEFPRSDDSLLNEMTSLALECWRAFDLSGYARVDFRVDKSGRPWILEVNTNPCLAPDAGFAAALAEAGIPFARAIARIVLSASAEFQQSSPQVARTAAP